MHLIQRETNYTYNIHIYIHKYRLYILLHVVKYIYNILYVITICTLANQCIQFYLLIFKQNQVTAAKQNQHAYLLTVCTQLSTYQVYIYFRMTQWSATSIARDNSSTFSFGRNLCNKVYSPVLVYLFWCILKPCQSIIITFPFLKNKICFTTVIEQNKFI